MRPCLPANDVVEYESWNLSDVEPPPRSRLYHLNPAAFGTGLVESLTSYFPASPKRTPSPPEF